MVILHETCVTDVQAVLSHIVLVLQILQVTLGCLAVLSHRDPCKEDMGKSLNLGLVT